MSIATVLICDDDEAVHESLASYFGTVDIDVISAYNGEDALSVLQKEKINLVILDIMMPKMFGTEVCKTIRKTSDVPIIMLSARGEELDRILGLELGADDYITKPFSPREVATRALVILRRMSVIPPPEKTRRKLSFRELQLDLDASEVWINGQNISFTLKERAMLAFFVQNAGIALSRDQIMNNVWGYDYYGDTRAVDTMVKRLRKKLPKSGTHFEITSVHGIGYKLEERNE